MADSGERTDQYNLLTQAWNRAWAQGYVKESVCYHAVDDFWNVASGAIVGMAGGLAAILVVETSGAVAGGALAAYFTAGNPAAVAAGAECGFIIGQFVAEGALTLMGVYFLYEFVKEHIGLLWPNLVCAYDLMVNQAPRFTGNVLAMMVDMAARQIAEAIGVFCGLMLSALVLFVTYKITSAKEPGKPDLAELTKSKLATMSQGLVQWLIPKLGILRRTKTGPPKLRVLQGGLPSDTMSSLTIAMRCVKELLPSVVSAQTRLMVSRNIGELNSTLSSYGFKLISAEEFGPPGGWQVFWQKGNVLIRFKSMGDKFGPRAGKPHMSIGFNDGRGLAWQNDMGKFTYTGKIVAKVITAADKFQDKDFQGNAQKFVMIPQKFEITAVDEWAGQTHFNADSGFGLKGLEQLVAPFTK